MADGAIHGTLYRGQWITFTDANGPGFAQPDYFILQPEQVLLFECKLTQTEEAWRQLRSLYGPLLAHIFERPIISVQVCHNLTSTPPIIITSPSSSKDGAILHWLGGR